MKKIINKLKKSKRVGIIAHISPDEDCLGSMSALSLILNEIGIQTHMFVDTKKDHSEYPLFDFDETYNDDLIPSDYDLLISVDVPSKRMLGKYANAFSEFNNTISIDHHDSRDLEARIVFNKPNASSCSELIYKLALELNVNITPLIASYLFAGIVGDTSCFEHDNVTAETHLVAAELYKLGANTKRIIYLQKKAI